MRSRNGHADQIRRLLSVIPETTVGLPRGATIPLTRTGSRKAEVLNLKAGDITVEDGRSEDSTRTLDLLYLPAILRRAIVVL